MGSTLGKKPADQVTSGQALANGTVTPIKLSGGAPAWDVNGNLALGGATPASWSGIKAFQIGALSALSSDGNSTWLSHNWYNNGTDRYLASGAASIYRQANGSHQLYTAPAGAEGAVIPFTKSFDLAKGKSLALEGASPSPGTGISFPPTQNPSSDANTLDDYEEGTFTAVVNRAGGSFTRSGQYTKIGRVVHIRITVDYDSATGTTNSLISINGLPFTEATGNSTPAPCGLFYAMKAANGNASSFPGFIVGGLSTGINLYMSVLNTYEDLPRFNNANAYFQICATYFTT